jgi:nanoRNase/pAp phosphatase (c-di-AMP/oligoRNAs hydrolase)
MRNFGPDTIVSVARGVADDLAEESGHVSLVVFYDALEVSDLIQFRCRRSRSYQALDLRGFLEALEIENGGGHAGAIGFRVPRDQVSDFDAEVSRLSHILNRMIAQSGHDSDGNSIT